MDVGIDTEKIPLFNEDGDNPGYDETGEQFEMDKNTDTSTSSGSFNPTSSNRTYEETSFGGEPSGTTSLDEREKMLTKLCIKLRLDFQNLIRLNHHSLLA